MFNEPPLEVGRSYWCQGRRDMLAASPPASTATTARRGADGSVEQLIAEGTSNVADRPCARPSSIRYAPAGRPAAQPRQEQDQASRPVNRRRKRPRGCAGDFRASARIPTTLKRASDAARQGPAAVRQPTVTVFA